LLYTGELPQDIKTFPYKQKLRESIATRPAIPELFKGNIQVEIKGHERIKNIKFTTKGKYSKDKYRIL
jgi:hypothetical protein